MPDLSSEDQQRLDTLNAKRAELLAQRVAALKQEVTGQLPDDTTTVGEAFAPEQLVGLLHKHGLTLGPDGQPVLLEDTQP